MRSKISSKDQIIEIAEKIIARDGVNGLKVRCLSKETGLAVGTIYNYFSSQEELIEEVFVLSWNKTNQRLTNIVNSNHSIEDKLTSFFDQLDTDIKARKGIGDYVLSKILFKKSFANSKFDFFDKVALLLEKIFIESPKYTYLTKEELKVSAQLALLGYLHFNHKDTLDIDIYKKVILDKFI